MPSDGQPVAEVHAQGTHEDEGRPGEPAPGRPQSRFTQDFQGRLDWLRPEGQPGGGPGREGGWRNDASARARRDGRKS